MRILLTPSFFSNPGNRPFIEIASKMRFSLKLSLQARHERGGSYPCYATVPFNTISPEGMGFTYWKREIPLLENEYKII